MFKDILISAILLTVLPCVRAEQGLSQEYQSCIKNAQATSILESCISVELHKQDVRLQQAYQDLAYRLRVDQRETLIAAQQLWSQFAKVNCELYKEKDGGSLANVVTSKCILRATTDRADELEKLANK